MTGDPPAEHNDRALPNAVLLVSALHLAIGIALWFLWQVGAGSLDWVVAYFRSAGSLFLVATAALEFGLTLFIRSRFERGELLSPAWTLLTLAAGARLVGHTSAHVLGLELDYNPLRLLLSPMVAVELQRVGLIIGGPLHMLLLAGGFAYVLAAYRKVKMLGRFSALDWLVLAAGVFFSVQQMCAWPLWYGPISQFDVLARISWASDPLLGLLLAEALLLRRSALRFGGGLIADCWRGYAVGACCTLLGDVGIWATAYGHLAWPVSSITWYIWIPAAAAFAYAPSCQAAAMVRAVRRSRVLSATE